MKHFLLLLYVFCFMAKSQAQTKEESMDWLNNYAAKITCCKNNGDNHMEIKVGDDGEMTILIPQTGRFIFNLADVQIDNGNPF